MDLANPTPSPAPLRFTLPDSITVAEIPPVTIDQARRALRLDPDDGHNETHKEGIFRLAAQAEILLGPDHEYLLSVLAVCEMHGLIVAIFRAACGEDKEQYAHAPEVIPLVSVTFRPLGGYRLLRQLEAVCIDLAALLGKLPSELGTMPLDSALALCHEHRLASAGTASPAQPFPSSRL